jgi:predicted RNase H-like nuclease
VDGYRGGWIAAVDEGTRISIRGFARFGSLLADESLSPVVIDIPIGLPTRGARPCDVAARRLLGTPRSSSVFPAPMRPLLPATTYAEACAIRRQIEGKAVSKQLFHILDKVGEVDEAMTPALQARVREGHPEVSFAALAGAPMLHRKSSAAGRAERTVALEAALGGVDPMLGFAPAGAKTDVVDALACLWTARRAAAGRAGTLPEMPAVDERGLKMEIVY